MPTDHASRTCKPSRSTCTAYMRLKIIIPYESHTSQCSRYIGLDQSSAYAKQLQPETATADAPCPQRRSQGSPAEQRCDHECQQTIGRSIMCFFRTSCCNRKLRSQSSKPQTQKSRLGRREKTEKFCTARGFQSLSDFAARCKWAALSDAALDNVNRNSNHDIRNDMHNRQAAVASPS